MNKTKAKTWNGYFEDYVQRARERGIEPVALLDEEWYDGKKTAESSVLPYISPESVVLEIACGVGRVSRHVASHCKQLCCTDILAEALSQTKHELRQFDNVVFRLLNGYDLEGFADNRFDCVYSFTTFFHFDFELVVVYFAEIKRVLKPGGIAVLEFKRWQDAQDVRQLLDKIESRGGIREYEADLDKWRYVSVEMLKLLCDYFEFDVVGQNLTRFAFRKLA